MGGEEEVDRVLVIAEDQGASDLVVVLDESESLGSESVGDAMLSELLEGAVRVEHGGGVDIAHADRKAIPGEVAALEFVGVQIDPLDGEFVVAQRWEILRGLSRRVDGDDLLCDRVLVFESGVSDGSLPDFEVTRDDVAELERGEPSFFDEHIDVLAVPYRLVERELSDEEIVGTVFDRASDSWDVTREVHGSRDGGVEGGEIG